MGPEALIVIPVRGGSVGIPRKAVKPLAGIPPLIRTLHAVSGLGRVVVVTDDAEIDTMASHYALMVSEPKLQTPPGAHALDPVIASVMHTSDAPIVVTVQCTCPFLERVTVQSCIAAVALDGFDTALTVRDDRHLRWERCPTETFKHNMPLRLTRQQMAPSWRETGGCLATRREYVTSHSRFGPHVKLIPVSGIEALDLDTPEDWAIAEFYAGAQTNREALSARVLGEQIRRGIPVLLSGWGEPEIDRNLRREHVGLEREFHVPLSGAHTYDEAKLFLSPDIRECSIITSAYHQVRAFLTFLRVIQEQQRDRLVRIWNAPAPSRMEPMREEWNKISDYQNRGHVATYEDGLTYLDWRDSAE